MFYERKVKYLDYLENGERQRSGGFVKIEVRGEDCCLTAQVNGLHASDTFEGELFLQAENKEVPLSTLQFRCGRANLKLLHLNSHNLGQTGISYDSLAGIRIPVGIRREVSCVWKEGAVHGSVCQERGGLDEAARQEQLDLEELSRGAEPREEPEKCMETVTSEEPEKCMETVTCEEGAEPREDAEMRPEPETCEEAVEPREETKMCMEAAEPQKHEAEEKCRKPPNITRLLENKWQQLSAIYPHIAPFEDERDYLSISPADFVVLPEKYYRMVNNSFLLHGYYNYEHLILAKTERRGEIIYYMGVPGNFYDREKQIAVLFGFESFECMEEPAKQGDFGYYMMRLEL